MFSAKSIMLALLAALGVAASASADTIIADFKSDYVAGAAGQTRAQAKADGWNYLWNSGGSIGVATNYTSFVYNTATTVGAVYCGSSTTFPDSSGNDNYVFLKSGQGHPGRGTNVSGNACDRYAIAAYTVQAGEAGYVSIVNSSVTCSSTLSNGIDLRVYVNNTLMLDSVVAGGGSVSFNASLGSLAVGDIVYVCVGPNGNDGNDSFGLSYQLVMSTVPEPKACVLYTSGLLGLLGYTWRKRWSDRRLRGTGKKANCPPRFATPR